MQPPQKYVAVSEKVYGVMLRFYPESHRQQFGGQMAQLFRDQCRDAWQSGGYLGMTKLWLRVLPDFGKTVVMEQITELGRKNMKCLNTKNAPTALLIIGLTLALTSFSHFIVPFRGIFMLLVLASALAIFAKACVELFRPPTEYPRILLRTFILMFLYALIMPAWAKLKMHAAIAQPPGHDPFGLTVMACLFANPAVTVIKILQFFVQRRKS